MNIFWFFLVFILGAIISKSLGILWEVIFSIKKITHHFFFFLTGFFVAAYVLCHLILSFPLPEASCLLVNRCLLFSMNAMLYCAFYSIYRVFFAQSRVPYVFLVLSAAVLLALPFDAFISEPIIRVQGNFLGSPFVISYGTPGMLYYVCKLNIIAFFTVVAGFSFWKSALPLKYKMLHIAFLIPAAVIGFDIVSFAFLRPALTADAGWDSIYQAVKFTIFTLLFLVPNVETYLSISARLSAMEKEKEALQELVRERTSELEEQHRRRTDFFINLMHEFKTPLTLLYNQFNEYYSGRPPDEKLGMIKYSIDKLTADARRFFDARKLETGKPMYDHSRIADAGACAETALRLYQEYAARKGLHLTGEVEKDLFVQADANAVTAVFVNLLDNAVKYSAPNGTIRLKMKRGGRDILLSVEDDGIGIAKDQLDKIFLPYYQISHPKANVQGLGMGLYIVKCILDQLGATINVGSAPGRGSRFNIAFRAHERKAGETPQPAAVPVIAAEPVMTLAAGAVDPAKATILVVEDNELLLAFLVDALRPDYNVLFGRSAGEALRLLAAETAIDLVLSDIMMDGLDGYQFVEKVRADSRYAGTPVIFLTAKTTDEDRRRGLETGAVDFISKPFVMEEVKTKIATILGHLKSVREGEREAIRREIETMLAGGRRPAAERDAAVRNVESVFARSHFSKREKEVFRFLTDGKSNKEIAAALAISLSSAKSHVFSIFKKFGVSSRLALMNKIYGQSE